MWLHSRRGFRPFKEVLVGSLGSVAVFLNSRELHAEFSFFEKDYIYIEEPLYLLT